MVTNARTTSLFCLAMKLKIIGEIRVPATKPSKINNERMMKSRKAVIRGLNLPVPMKGASDSVPINAKKGRKNARFDKRLP